MAALGCARLLRGQACGIDGCRAGWLVASAPDPASAPAFTLLATFAEVVRLVEGGARIACVDVPIGLADRPRGCDAAARALLAWPRAASVFTPPCRRALSGRTAAEARAWNLAATGRSLSAQTLGIVPKIREVDAAMRPGLQRLIREAHPEVIFASLGATGAGLAPSKKTAVGRALRLGLLPPPFARAVADPARLPFPRRAAAPDDYLDALAALVTALRVSRGEARQLPAGAEERDERGLRMEIVY